MANITHPDIEKIRRIERLDGIFSNVITSISTRGDLPRYPTGLEDLDEMIWGIHKKELLVIGARPTEGKSSLGLQIAWSLSNSQKRVLFLSLEMSKEQLVERLLSHTMEINNLELRRGSVSEESKAKMATFKDIVEDLPLLITDNMGYDVSEIDYLVSHLDPPIEVLFLDYIQLCHMGRFHSRVDAITEYLRAVKELSIKYDFAAVVLSQINRAATERKDRRPQLQDLKGCVEENTMIDGIPIKTIYKNQLYRKVSSYNQADKTYTLRYPASVLDSGEKDCLELTTESGKKVIVSTDTKLLINDDKWVKSTSLKVGDTILTHTENKNLCTNSGKTWFAKGGVPWNKGKKVTRTESMERYYRKQRGVKKPKPPTFSKTMQKANPPKGIKIKYGPRQSDKKHRVWRGGYVFIYKPDYPSSRKNAPDRGYILEHRYVMEHHIVRQIRLGEVIHHLDGRKDNNEISNLVLCKDTQQHNAIHNKMEMFMEESIRNGKIKYDSNKETFFSV